ncbi:MAG: hypothetical protein FK730_05425 [Asgard group archaeon]|nr:hypothetical protein [Asgard group archaeon]
MKLSFKKQYLLFAIIITIFSLQLIMFQNSAAFSITKSSLYESSSTHDLKIYDFSHYNKPIYANYTTVNITMLFQSPEIDLADISAHYSSNGINWTTIALTKTESLLDNRAFFIGTLGPFIKSGEYQLKVNASRINTEYASAFYRFNVVKIRGILFIDLSYKVKEQSDQSQHIDLYINVIGDDIKLGSVYVSTDQQEDVETSYKMNFQAESDHTYWATLGPTNTWQKTIKLTFFANTSDNTKYINSNFIILKDTVFVPEKFWTSKFPAILLGAVVMGVFTTIFIMNRRRGPKKFDV